MTVKTVTSSSTMVDDVDDFLEQLLVHAEEVAKEDATIDDELSAIHRRVQALEARRDVIVDDLEDLREEIGARLVAIRGEAAARDFSSLIARYMALWPAAKCPDSQHYVAELADPVAA